MAIDPYLLALPNKNFKLSEFNTKYTGDFKNKDEAKAVLKAGIKKMRVLQDKLYALDKHSVLIVFQAMDAAGKDGTIKHVMSGINPQGCIVHSFKQPSKEELGHDFLWRTNKALPERGMIGIFNRSYYEEVLITKVHPEILLGQKIPDINSINDIKNEFWKSRYERINNFENHITESGTIVLKFYLNVSKEEQKKRFLSRIENPDKNWKFTINDINEREHWNKYQIAFEEMINATSTTVAPWHVIPADNKWYMRTAVAEIIIDKLESLDLHYPTISNKQKDNLKKAKDILGK